MEAFLEHRPKDAFGRHRYDPADFGWTYAGLAEEFGDYTERYHIRSEIKIDQPTGDDAGTSPVRRGAARRYAQDKPWWVAIGGTALDPEVVTELLGLPPATSISG